MSLNIKNEHVHALVREAARRTGMSQTSVVEEAMRRLLRELDSSTAVTAAVQWQEVEDILTDLHSRLTPDSRTVLTTDDLYDEQGMPA
ncbi:type II toxin-antitoxin system VapB family antitoxin [Nocardia otitidiscaviarum]|uniref:type II toxin-antitoxin system VapB family antitoxin n=1 Tax=Nocardia TaxID=1817 RepID=UPI000B1D8275|nr:MULTISPECIES: type II toxin-antitoxin system VapB family antitoxin [Nocardia]MBF6131979.1 type II toxin-antitoxin system VapB family antitoxin [Nocardia otitidiscaviarum]MBF6238643.1 type II toxin-antitoxin system VapB family antitoxin [Nocardia otitidiscaviarum]MBF6483110.1 type II toxin-antitoxin system VapB family antitoxin [Nocardia otitidiscaviarum]